MQTPIVLSSVDGAKGSSSHDFIVSFHPQISLNKNWKHYICLDTLNMSYSWYNVTSEYDNHKFKYSVNDGSSYNFLTFKDGIYSYDDINNIISKDLIATGNSATGIQIHFDKVRLRTFISLEEHYIVTFNSGNFRFLVGFHRGLVLNSRFGDFSPDITNSVDNSQCHCSLISSSSVGGVDTDVLYQFSTSGLNKSYPFEREPRMKQYNEINTKTISKIRIYFTDSLGRTLNLNGVQSSVTLSLKAIKPT